jgi:hypothetical protein
MARSYLHSTSCRPSRSILIGLVLLLVGMTLPAPAQFEAKEDFFQPQAISETNYLEQEIELQELDAAEWQRLTENLDYGAMPVQEEESERSTATRRSKSSNPVVATILKFLLIGGGIAALAYLLFLYFSGAEFGFPGSRKSRNTKLDIEVGDLEKNLPNIQLDNVLDRAVEEKDFRLATRIRYLNIIQQLNSKEYIQWKKDKTNGQYTRELRGTELEAPFRALTRIFDWMWYGKAEINEQEYTFISQQYETMEQALARAKSLAP